MTPVRHGNRFERKTLSLWTFFFPCGKSVSLPWKFAFSRTIPCLTGDRSHTGHAYTGYYAGAKLLMACDTSLLLIINKVNLFWQGCKYAENLRFTFFMQNKILYYTWKSPDLYDTLLWIKLKGLKKSFSILSLALSCLSDVGMWSQLSECINSDSCQARVCDLKRDQWQFTAYVSFSFRTHY